LVSLAKFGIKGSNVNCCGNFKENLEMKEFLRTKTMQGNLRNHCKHLNKNARLYKAAKGCINKTHWFDACSGAACRLGLRLWDAFCEGKV
jgi:hypothetical protein